jgi:mannose-6-phosphate isomerase-like protein (cupin superfamily)
MPYTRRISAADAAGTGYQHYQAGMPVGIESATMVSGYLDDGAHPPLHVHDVDQFFIVLGGSATMWLANDAHQAKAGEIIYIPANTRTAVTTTVARTSTILSSWCRACVPETRTCGPCNPPMRFSYPRLPRKSRASRTPQPRSLARKNGG